MAKRESLRLLVNTIDEILPDGRRLFVDAFDKVGFDLDVIGRKRHIQWLEEAARSAYAAVGMNVNIAVWNMHLPEDHHFSDILDSGLCKMGEGGGFRIVVFRGSGWIRNDGARGFENWRCSGNQRIEDNVIRFKPV